MELSERHKLESRFATRIARATGKFRSELLGHSREFAKSYPEYGSFTNYDANAELNKKRRPLFLAFIPVAFWDTVKSSLQSELTPVLFMLWMASASQHGADTESDDAQRAGQQWAETRAQEISQGYADHSRDNLDRWLSGETKVAGDGASIEDVSAQIFGTTRAESIATTETTTAQAAGSEWWIKFSGQASEDDTWFTAEDDRVCKICGPLHNAPRSWWEQRFPKGPPAHPNCRCYLAYVGIDEPEEAIA